MSTIHAIRPGGAVLQGTDALHALFGTVGQTMGTLAVALAAVNVFGGFLVTRRMLEMFRRKEPKAAKGGDAA